jgi:hypothetical protein
MGYHYLLLDPCKFCDLVRDGTITFQDFAAFATNWLKQGCAETNGWCNGADFTFDSKVDARDLATFAECWLVSDTTPPVPNPSQWQTEPFMASGTSASMMAATSVDDWGWPVEYYFECTEGGGHDSGWQSSTVYTDKNLKPGLRYGYHVKARDGKGNETQWSIIAYTGSVDKTPPAPVQSLTVDPNTANPYISLIITAPQAFDPEDNGVQYYFDCNTPGGHDSGWISTRTYADVNLVPNTAYSYRYKVRDLSANLNESAWSSWFTGRTSLPADTIPPTPNPEAFDPNGLPRIYSPTGAWDAYLVEMEATAATDNSGGAVQYEFEVANADLNPLSGMGSGWIATNVWRFGAGQHLKSTQGLSLFFRCRARDASGNMTGWSDWINGAFRPNQAALP